jgi:hypothetical protein
MKSGNTLYIGGGFLLLLHYEFVVIMSPIRKLKLNIGDNDLVNISSGM